MLALTLLLWTAAAPPPAPALSTSTAVVEPDAYRAPASSLDVCCNCMTPMFDASIGSGVAVGAFTALGPPVVVAFIAAAGASTVGGVLQRVPSQMQWLLVPIVYLPPLLYVASTPGVAFLVSKVSGSSTTQAGWTAGAAALGLVAAVPLGLAAGAGTMYALSEYFRRTTGQHGSGLEVVGGMFVGAATFVVVNSLTAGAAAQTTHTWLRSHRLGEE